MDFNEQTSMQNFFLFNLNAQSEVSMSCPMSELILVFFFMCTSPSKEKLENLLKRDSYQGSYKLLKKFPKFTSHYS